MGGHGLRRRPLAPPHRLGASRRSGGRLRGVRPPPRALRPHPGRRARGGPPGHPPRRSDPPRPEAVQRPDDDRRPPRHRLRYRPSPGHRRGRRPHPHRRDDRLSRVHGAGAGTGRAGDARVRRVLPGLRAGLRGDRPAAVRFGGQRGPRADVPGRPGGPGPHRRTRRPRRTDPGLPGEGPGRAALHGHRPGAAGRHGHGRALAPGRADRAAGPARRGAPGLRGPGARPRRGHPAGAARPPPPAPARPVPPTPGRPSAAHTLPAPARPPAPVPQPPRAYGYPRQAPPAYGYGTAPPYGPPRATSSRPLRSAAAGPAPPCC